MPLSAVQLCCVYYGQPMDGIFEDLSSNLNTIFCSVVEPSSGESSDEDEEDKMGTGEWVLISCLMHAMSPTNP